MDDRLSINMISSAWIFLPENLWLSSELLSNLGYFMVSKSNSNKAPSFSSCAGPGVGHTSTVWDLSFNPAGDQLASCSDDCTLRIWECTHSHGEMRCVLGATCSGYHTRTIFSVDWSQSGYIATGSADNSICIFSVRASSFEEGVEGMGQVSCRLECRKEQAHSFDVNCVRWHPKIPGLLASAGDDGAIRLWQFEPAAG